MRRRILPLLAVLGALGLSACNTIAGIGADLQAAGGAITGGSRPTQGR